MRFLLTFIQIIAHYARLGREQGEPSLVLQRCLYQGGLSEGLDVLVLLVDPAPEEVELSVRRAVSGGVSEAVAEGTTLLMEPVELQEECLALGAGGVVLKIRHESVVDVPGACHI